MIKDKLSKVINSVILNKVYRLHYTTFAKIFVGVDCLNKKKNMPNDETKKAGISKGSLIKSCCVNS